MISQRRLINKLITQAKEKKPSIGIVHWVDGTRVDIRIPGSSTVYRNCVVEGDATYIERGSSVVLAWYQKRPTVIAPSDQKFVTSGEMADALAKLDLDTKTGVLEWNIVVFRYGGYFDNFPADAGGLTSALSSGGTDAIVMLPECTIEGDFTVPQGIHLAGMGINSRIEGHVICQGAGLMNFAAYLSGSSSEDETAVTLDNFGELEIRDCNFKALQTGVGDAFAVSVIGTRPVYIFDSYIEGIHDYGGNAYGIQLLGDDVYMYGGYLGGTTAPYLGV